MVIFTMNFLQNSQIQKLKIIALPKIFVYKSGGISVLKLLKMFAEIIGVVVVGVVCVIAIMVELLSNGADYE